MLNCACVVQLDGKTKIRVWLRGWVCGDLCLSINTKNESELQESVTMMPPHFIDEEIKYKLVSALVTVGLCDVQGVSGTGVFMGCLDLSLLKPGEIVQNSCVYLLSSLH